MNASAYGLLWAATLLAAPPAFGQTISGTFRGHLALSAANIVVPQARAFAHPGLPGRVDVVSVDASVEILEQVATTTLDIAVTNASGSLAEAQMVLPVPEGATLRGFTFQGGAPEAAAELLARDEARRVYDSIVAKVRDPAILEFAGCNLIQSRVFPVPARGGQKVRVTYEHLLSRDGERVDYVLPRSESVDYRVPWRIGVKIKSKTPIGTVYSPSHSIETVRRDPAGMTVKLSAAASTEPGPFRLSYLLQSGEMTASLLAYPDAKIGGGYFLFLAGAPSRPNQAAALKREVIVVLDRSGSMAGEKMDQAREAALQVLEGLEDGERFNLIVYNEGVETFAPQPVVKTPETMREARAYLRGVRVRGGTNIHDALQEALRMKTATGTVPIVLFLTDGLPTVGQTSERSIREVVAKGNPHHRRVFTFGVGGDVNTPLLDRIALETRAVATYVLPREDIEVRVAQIFKRLAGPVLVEPKLRALSTSETGSTVRVREIQPGTLPDVFEGDQLVILGQYQGEEPLGFELRGDYGGRERVFRFRFNLDKATTRNAFVPRLWASRKIAVLTDAIRDLGIDGGAPGASDPRMRELVDEIVRLSKDFGILSEYTAFLAREGTDLSNPANAVAQAYDNFRGRAASTRSGWASVNQSINNGFARSQAQVNSRNGFYDAQLNRVEIGTVQQVSNGAFYNRGNRWIDSSLLSEPNASPTRVVEVGSEEFRKLADRLAAENRQGAMALQGEILLRVGNEKILVK